MKKNLIIATIVGILLLLVLVIFLAVSGGKSINETPQEPLFELNPVVPLQGDPSVSDPSSDSFVLAKDGRRFPVENLIARSDTIAYQDDFYQLATNDSDKDLYAIYFYTGTGLISIDIFSEPLGSVRFLAEQALATTLGLPTDQICFLDIVVSTNRYVNEQFAGVDLGLSFCPGSIQF